MGTVLKLAVDPQSIKGFLAPSEGQRLYELARVAGKLGPVLEVGSYCGKSTVYLGAGVRDANSQLFAVDHHRGSEEHQPGEGYHDPALFDDSIGRMDSLPTLRQTLARADLEQWVTPIVASSAQAGRFWQTPLSMVFIDGGHSLEAALTDYRTWIGHIRSGGYLAIHDIFPDPADGGQAPYEIYQRALQSGLFTDLGMTETLATLQRL